MSTAQTIALQHYKVNIKSQRKAILDHFKNLEHSNQYKCSVATGIKESSVKSRISELYKDGILYLHHEFNDGMNSAYAYEDDIYKQNFNRKLREDEGFERWKKKGDKDGYFERYLRELNV